MCIYVWEGMLVAKREGKLFALSNILVLIEMNISNNYKPGRNIKAGAFLKVLVRRRLAFCAYQSVLADKEGSKTSSVLKERVKFLVRRHPLFRELNATSICSGQC